MRPSLLTKNLSDSSGSYDTGSPAGQRADAKKSMYKAMRPLPTQHYWNVYFDRPPPPGSVFEDEAYTPSLGKIGSQIESVQDFWRYHNNLPVEQIRMRESVYLFKEGFPPLWEDRRNINGGSWTLRVPKSNGPDLWTRVQLMAIGEKLQSCLEPGDQLCGVGLSVRFNSHQISIWHRDASKQGSIDAMLATVLEELPPEMQPNRSQCFYKKHSERVAFNGGAVETKESPSA